MIYSYLDTLLDKWIEWSEGFLSKKLTANVNDINAILGTSGSDNPTRANEFNKIGFLKLPLTGSGEAFQYLRNESSIHSDLGYLSYLIRKGQKIDENNQKLIDGFKAISAFSLIQLYVEYSKSEISLNFIFQSLLEKYPIPPNVNKAAFLRYLSASMFCELDYDSDALIQKIISGNPIQLRLIQLKTNTTLFSFNGPQDIVKAINSNVSLGNIRYTKGSTFFIGNHETDNPRGLFYQAYQKFADFLFDHYQIEKRDIAKSPFIKIYNKSKQLNIFSELSDILKTNSNFSKLMITLEEGCIEALNTLKWIKKADDFKLNDSSNTIFFGAPGTGKSHKVNEIIASKLERTQRVTFHPEYDYASFVGGYKPSMDGDVIRYEFVPQAFTKIYVKAWNDPGNQYYLVIEEINRGNCAEIFGDIFQLLDRGSDYDVTPSLELENYLKENLDNENKGLENGRIKLPSNLTIFATMNTSDQSLFPMDSAFKRRWDWEYIPICYEEDTEEGRPNPSFNYIVDLDDESYFRWNDFILKINLNYIQQNPVLGMDKCIGNYFVKPKLGDNKIDVETFINKAIFYLWNDVFKDEKNEVFEENGSYEDFFPIKTKGIQKLKELLSRIDVTIEKRADSLVLEKDEATN